MKINTGIYKFKKIHTLKSHKLRPTSNKIRNAIFNILVNKMNVGHYDEVIFETKYLIKKFPKQEALYNLLALTYQAKGEYDKSIDLLNDALKRSEASKGFLLALFSRFLRFDKKSFFEKSGV